VLKDDLYPNDNLINAYLDEVVEILKKDFRGSDVLVFDYPVKETSFTPAFSMF
jgi:hypothetical protein